MGGKIGARGSRASAGTLRRTAEDLRAVALTRAGSGACPWSRAARSWA
ncbi:MAG TPA: hypothetical protein VG148_13145 [Pyrinomonadaceae bacterium]|nr:hypothetical protein [Pyrinomonadaceae bacterium]